MALFHHMLSVAGLLSLLPGALSVPINPLPSPLAMFSTAAAMPRNFADPAIITVNDTYWAFATDDQVVSSNDVVSNNGVNVQVAHSADFSTWTYASVDILPDAGRWTSTPAHVWAPDVVQLDSGAFVLYYAAQPSAHPDVHCIGAATASSITGPYVPAPEALHCPYDEGGAIDPSGFRDPATGRRYVVWKVDGNNGQPGGTCGNENPTPRATPIRIQEVDAADGVTPVGPVVQILDRDDADGPLVEAPSLAAVRNDLAAAGWMYVLFFSSNCYLTPLYDVSYATSVNGVLNGADTSPVAAEGGQDGVQQRAAGGGGNKTVVIQKWDYQKASVPLMTSTDGKGLLGPGGLDVDVDGQHVVFHSAQVASDPGTRMMHYGMITTNGEIVSI